MLSLLYNSFLFNYYISFHTRIPGTDIIIAKMERNVQERFCRGQTGYNDSEGKVQHGIRTCNKCGMNNMLNWQNFWWYDWRNLKYWMLVFANFLLARHMNEKQFAPINCPRTRYSNCNLLSDKHLNINKPLYKTAWIKRIFVERLVRFIYPAQNFWHAFEINGISAKERAQCG